MQNRGDDYLAGSPKSERKAERRLWAEFEEYQPGLLRAIFDALSAGLVHYEALENPPRLADWAECAAAVYEGTGWGREQFLDDWSVIEETQNSTTLEGSPVAAAIVKFMEPPTHYEGPASDLLEKSKETTEDMGLNPQYNKAFPQASNWVWKRIKPVKPTLDGYGIQADQVEHGRGKAKRTVIVLDRTGGAGPVSGVVGDVKTNLLAPQIWLRNREKLVVGSVGPVKNRNRMIVGVRPKSRGNHHEPQAAPYGTRKNPPPLAPLTPKGYLSAKSGGSKEKSTGPVTAPTSELDFEGEARALYRLYREDPKRLLLDVAAIHTLIQWTYISTPDERCTSPPLSCPRGR